MACVKLNQQPPDALVVVSPYPLPVPDASSLSLSLASFALVVAQPLEKPFVELPQLFQQLQKVFSAAQEIDATVGSSVALVPVDEAPGRRVILSPTGPLNRDYDDVRRYADAAKSGLERALSAGSRRPCVVIGLPENLPEDFKHAQEVAVLSVLAAAHIPLEAREHTLQLSRVEALTFPQLSTAHMRYLFALEAGRAVARDIGGADPERMAAIRIVEYLEKEFADSCVRMTVEASLETLADRYPLLAAVARCSNVVERHRPRVVNLEYVGEGAVETTVFLVGKGITYDTGGADIKCSGHMAGMHRDKCGAAAVAGLFALLARTRPAGIRVVGKLALVRNSVGADSYVADEIIVSRSGVRVRIGNTDAEGRLVMSDLLCQAKEEAVDAPSPRIFTIATLTGHAVRAYGMNYSITMDNGPARHLGVSRSLAAAGHVWADPFEISTVRREDFDFVQSSYPTEDVVQCNNEPSSATSRGHQFPAAFMSIASGLDKHGLDSAKPLSYTHLDIAGSTKDWPEPVSAAPIPALAALFIRPRLGLQ
eukprot:m.229754 g.229754  ORF g.229754 m.229754 type:complete len:538 (-) comp17822_c0_seq1:81-1694(-)